MIGRINGLLLLLLGAASAAFALAGDYALLMNPTFRWVTIVGAVLVCLMGLVALLAGGAIGSRSALLVFVGFGLLVALAQPQKGGIAPLLVAPPDGPAITREGYTPIKGEDLFASMGQEATDVPTGKVRLRGFVKRLPELDARGEFILLEPLMACCLADAIALGARIRAPAGQLPEEDAWVVAFGTLQTIEPPESIPAFRVGAILFTAVSRTHRLQADEVVGYTALLPGLLDSISKERCGHFLELVELAGMRETLSGPGPFTVFAPVDSAFDALPAEQRAELFADPAEAEAIVKACVVEGRITKRALFDLDYVIPLNLATTMVVAENGKLRIGDARLLFGDTVARNGIVHSVHRIPAGDP